MVRERASAWTVSCFAVALLCAAPRAHAQPSSDPATAPPPVAANLGDKQVYTPADFARFAPRNALDMLRQVPGFTIRSGGQERGLGQASENVLLNGQRVPSKSGGAVDELEKISGDQVERIEIVNGATLDVPGLSGQVANVITKAQRKNSGQFSWTPEFRAHFTDPIFTRGSISYSGRTGLLDYTLALASEGSRSGAGGGTTLFNAAGDAIEFRDDVWRSNFDEPTATVRFALDGPGSSVANANIGVELEHNDFRETSERTTPGGVGRTRSIHEVAKGRELGLGADVAFDLAGGRLKLIGLFEVEKNPFITTAVSSFSDNSPATGDRLTQDGLTNELIGRAEYGWKWGRSDFQISAEAAYNSLAITSHLFQLSPAGIFTEIAFPAGSGRVAEDRYELLATYGRPLSSSLTMQLVAGGEHSTLSARGVTRQFLRPKGTLSLAWKADDKTDVNFKLTRVVGQLNFGDFLASVNFSSENANAGNVDLVPPQSWDISLETARNLGKWGSTRVTLYHHRVSDIVDTIPIGADGESLGNIDRAMRIGIVWKSTFLLDPIGWRGAKLDATFTLQRTRVRDPLTGDKRPISGSLFREAVLDFRHDIPGSDWAWGAQLFYSWRAPNVRLTEVSRFWEGPVWVNAFVEHKDVLGLTVRATIENIGNARSRLERTTFDGRRTDPIRFIEERNRLIGPIFSFSVRGNF